MPPQPTLCMMIEDAMDKTLTEQERKQLDACIAKIEKNTDAQLVLAVIERSDSYVELPWKAFALGASLAGLVVFVLDLLRPGWTTGTTVLHAVAATLVAGGAAVLLCLFSPGFARLFLHSGRAEAEVRQYAEALFLSRELFATSGRTGLLLLVSLFEREVVVLPDTGLRKRLSHDALQEVLARMKPSLTAGRIAHALEDGLNMLEERLPVAGPREQVCNELSDAIIEEKGQ